MSLTLQQAEDAAKASQVAFETASANLDKARTAARQDGPRPFGTVMTVADAKAAYDAALATRDADRRAVTDAAASADRPLDAMADLAAHHNRPQSR
ncbi:hypothetical protein FV226_24315 [Methylobacterium sp. WL12]|uniref:hypothetical protein n=1 Tax=Methylobacterium sp. WL12 TaxID=2603890 RepID=UPI0011C707B1|nr:hypothetical protein [Methylobacterium sp. WL12]TXM65874.1 hypothetical protein FV226_24315 [Methylobacterium sp. WL12]